MNRVQMKGSFFQFGTGFLVILTAAALLAVSAEPSNAEGIRIHNESSKTITGKVTYSGREHPYSLNPGQSKEFDAFLLQIINASVDGQCGADKIDCTLEVKGKGIVPPQFYSGCHFWWQVEGQLHNWEKVVCKDKK